MEAVENISVGLETGTAGRKGHRPKKERRAAKCP